MTNERGRRHRFMCPCCQHFTLDARGENDICPVCWWEDDGDWSTRDELERSGPNHGLTLGEGRARYWLYGVVSEHVAKEAREPFELERNPDALIFRADPQDSRTR